MLGSCWGQSCSHCFDLYHYGSEQTLPLAVYPPQDLFSWCPNMFVCQEDASCQTLALLGGRKVWAKVFITIRSIGGERWCLHFLIQDSIEPFQPSGFPQHSLLSLTRLIKITAFLWWRIVSDNCPDSKFKCYCFIWGYGESISASATLGCHVDFIPCGQNYTFSPTIS